MKPRYSKSIHLSVAMAVFLSPISPIVQNLSAGSFAEVADYGPYGIGHVGKVFSDGNSIGYQIGGKYRLKMEEPKPKPWFHVQAPEATLGCAGLSIKGMFGSLLNLDQIGEQLKDAGAAFAWGIILGLVTSLPSIKEVFDTINRWAGQIQGLLANACNVGKMLSSSSPVKGFLDDAAEQGGNWLSSTWGVKQAQETTGDVAKNVSKWLNAAEDFASGTTTKAEKYSVSFTILSPVFDKPGPMSNTLNSFAKETNTPLKSFLPYLAGINVATDKVTFISNPDTMMLETTPSTLTTAGALANYRLNIVTSIVASNFVGRLSMQQAYMTHLEEANNKMVSAIEATGASNTDIEKAIKDFTGKIKSAEDTRSIYPAQITVDEVINWMDGGTFSNKSDLNPKKLYMPKMVGLVSNASKGGTPKILLADVYENPLELTVDSTDLGWGGIIYSYGNVDKLARKQIDCVTAGIGGSSDPTCKDAPPVLLPGVARFMQIYSQSRAEDQIKVKEELVWYTKKLWKEAIIDAIQKLASKTILPASSGASIGSAPNGNTGVKNTQVKGTGFKENDYAAMKAVMTGEIKKLKEQTKETDDIALRAASIEASFKELAEKNAKRGISTTK